MARIDTAPPDRLTAGPAGSLRLPGRARAQGTSCRSAAEGGHVGRGRSRRVARMSVGALALMLTLGACSTSQWDKAFGFGWPEGLSTQSHAVRGLWTWSIAAAL